MRAVVLAVAASLLWFAPPASATEFSGTITSGTLPSNYFYEGSPSEDLAGNPFSLDVFVDAEGNPLGWSFVDSSAGVSLGDINNRPPTPGTLVYSGTQIVGFADSIFYDGDTSTIFGSVNSLGSLGGWAITRSSTGFSGIQSLGGTTFAATGSLNDVLTSACLSPRSATTRHRS
jgi:hypothetical protein